MINNDELNETIEKVCKKTITSTTDMVSDLIEDGVCEAVWEKGYNEGHTDGYSEGYKYALSLKPKSKLEIASNTISDLAITLLIGGIVFGTGWFVYKLCLIDEEEKSKKESE